MSTNIDENIVSMQFDNQDFEKKASSTMAVLEKLKEKLEFSSVDSSKIDRVFDRIEYRMSTLGVIGARLAENFADSISDVISSVISKATAGIRFAENGIISGGYRRASNIQAAKFQIEGLGLSWQKIYKDVDYAVTNTAYSLDAAAKVAGQLAAGSLKPGKDYVPISQRKNKDYVSQIDTLGMTLRAISGTAAMTNRDYSDVGRIFTSMVSRGRIYQTDINSLSLMGLGVKDLLADYLNEVKFNGKSNWNATKISEEIGKKGGGKITPDILIEMLYEKFGEYATKANQTLSGVTANLKSAFARIGETFFEPIIENGGPLVNLIDGLRVNINALNSAIKPVVKMIGEDLAEAIQYIASFFYEDEIMLGSDGKPVKDPTTGEVMTKKVAKKNGPFGGLFEEKEYKRLEKLSLNYYKLPEEARKQYRENGAIIEKDGTMYMEVVEKYSNAGRVMFNIWSSIKNVFSGVGEIISNIGIGFGFMTSKMSFIEILIKGTERLRILTEKFRNPSSKTVTLLISMGKAMGSILTIATSFAKSVYKHIIDPIFGGVKNLVPGVNLTDRLLEFNARLTQLASKVRNSEDFFGPFIEKFKNGVTEFWNMLKSWGEKIKQGISNFFKPIKDILSDSNLSWFEKLKSIGSYLKEDFIMPGWEKVKGVFEGISDAIHSAIDAIKDFLGIKDKDEGSTVTTTGAAPGGRMSGYMAFANINPAAVVGVADSLEQASEKLDTASSNGVSALERISDFFKNNSFNPLMVAFTITLLSVAAVTGALIYLILTLPKKLKEISDQIPKLFLNLGNAITGFITSVNKVLKATAFKQYTAGFKDLGIMLLTVIGAVGIVLLMMKLFDTSDIIKAGIYVGVIASLLTGLAVALLIASRKMAQIASISIIKDKGLTASYSGGMMEGVILLLRSILSMTTMIIAIGAVFAIVDHFGGEDALMKGIKIVGIIVAAIGGFIILLPFILGLLEKIPKIGVNLSNTSKALFGMAAALSAITVTVISITAVIALLGILPGEEWFNKGLVRLIKILGVILVFDLVATLIAKFGATDKGTKRSSVAASLLSLGAVLLSIAIAVTSITISIALLSTLATKLSGFDKAVWTVMAVTALTGILAIALTKIVAVDLKDQTHAVGKLLSIAAIFISIAGSTMIIVGAIAILTTIFSSLEQGKMWSALAAIGVIAAFMLGTFEILKHLAAQVKGTSRDDYLKIGGAFLAIAGSLMLISLAVLAIGSLDFTTALQGLGGIVVVSLILFGLLAATSKWVKLNTTFVKAATAMIIVAGSVVVMSAAVIAMGIAFDNISASASAIAMITAGMIIVGMIGMMAVLLKMVKGVNGSDAVKAGIMIAIASGAMAVTALSVAALIKAIMSSGINQGIAVAVMAAFAGVMIAIFLTMAKVVKYASTASWQQFLAAAVQIVAVGASLALVALSLVPLAKQDVSGIFASGIVVGALGAVIGYISTKVVKAQRLTMAGDTARAIISYAGVAAALGILALGLSALAKYDWHQIAVAGASILLIGVAVAGLVAIAKLLSAGGTISTGFIATIGAMAVMMAAIGATAFLVAEAIKILIEAFDLFFQKQAEWSKDGGMLEKFRAFLSGIFSAVALAISDAATDIAGAIGSIIFALINAFTDNAVKIGLALYNALGTAVVFLKTLFDTGAAGFIIDGFIDIGVACGKGIIQGLTKQFRRWLSSPSAWIAKKILGIEGYGVTDDIRNDWIQNTWKKQNGTQEKLDEFNKMTGFVLDVNEENKLVFRDSSGNRWDSWEDYKKFGALSDKNYMNVLKDVSLNEEIWTTQIAVFEELQADFEEGYRNLSDNVLQSIFDGIDQQTEEGFDALGKEGIKKIAEIYSKNKEQFELIYNALCESLGIDPNSGEKKKDPIDYMSKLPGDIQQKLREQNAGFNEAGKLIFNPIKDTIKMEADDYMAKLPGDIQQKLRDQGAEFNASGQIIYNNAVDGVSEASINAENTNKLNQVGEAGAGQVYSGAKTVALDPKTADDLQNALITPITNWSETNLKKVLDSGKTVGFKFQTGVNEELEINSPSKAMIRTMGYVADGIEIGGENASAIAYDVGTESGKGIMDGFGSTVSDSMKDMKLDLDFEGTADNVKNSIQSRLPSWDELKGYVGLDKGIKGNIDGIKAAWARIKSGFLDENGNFIGIESLFGDLFNMDKLTSGINSITPSFGFDQTSILTPEFENQLANFDINDYVGNSTIDINTNMDINDSWSPLMDTLNGNTQMSLVPAGLMRSGPTYVTNNNYNYVQNNTSSGPLNTRELNRSTERALTRRKWDIGRGGYYR